MIKSPIHHISHPEWFFDYFHQKVHHAFLVFGLAIIGMLWGASNILSITSASWQWWGFLSSDFWQQNPTNANVMYALFGDGTPSSTAYTRLWDSSCIPTDLQILPTNFSGLTWLSNTIYILNPGNYTLTSPIVMDDCSALIGMGDVIIKANTTGTYITIPAKNNIIFDNFQFDWNSLFLENINIQNANNITLHGIKSYYSTNYWLYAADTTNMLINNSYFFKDTYWLFVGSGSRNISINNVLTFDTSYGIKTYNAAYMSINNTQTFNNNYWMYLEDMLASPWSIVINNSIVYNNDYWITDAWSSWYLYNVNIYNNNRWIHLSTTSWWIEYYWSLHMFNNTLLVWWFGDIIPWLSSILDRSAWSLDTSVPSLSYDWLTNPQNGSGQRLLSWTNRTWLRLQQLFDSTKKPIRYIFWSALPKQTIPVWYHSDTLEKYWYNWADYMTIKYISEPEYSLPTLQQSLVNQYFGSGAIFTQNRETNWCSLSAFQVKILNSTTFTSTYNFEDHTIYLLTGGEYISTMGGIHNGFVFNGNCIALIGTPTTRFTKSGAGTNALLYANNKHNIIIDTIKVDALYYNNATQTSSAAQSAIKFDGANNNSTINNVQTYNATSYGIFLGLNSHHTTIINTQSFNNLVAGIHLYYSSNYNVITNTQVYNNNSYGIWFANGSKRNTLNNFQSYNNTIGVFWDLTTQENVLNRAAIYNNSDAGIYLKNASNNIFNDVRLHNNAIGIRTLYSSLGNIYYGNLELFGNTLGNFDGTTGSDIYLSPGSAGFFPYGGTLITGNTGVSCLYVTNPMLLGNSLSLLTWSTCATAGFVPVFMSAYSTYINYVFGSYMYKQKIPVRYTNGNTLVQLPSQYDSTKYIAEPFAISTTLLFWPDTIPPTTPTIIYPITGDHMFFIIFQWTASTDIGSWMEGYVYEIAEDSSFTSLINTGFITSATGMLGSPNTGFGVRDGSYYWRLKAKDKNGNYSSWSNIWYFSIVDNNNLDFTNKNNASLNTYYDSNEITLGGITTWRSLWASVDDTTLLYKNGINRGTGTLVENGDDVYISLRSSTTYDTSVISRLTLANRTLTFSITTKQESNNWCTLSTDDKATIQTIFDSLIQNYSGDINKFDEFLYTMQSMLADQIDFTDDCNLQYLENLISLAINGSLGWPINTGNHIAPNCKEYPVSFDYTKIAYTSPLFKVITFFANRDALTRYIDSKNPGDCHINTYGISSWIFTNNDPSKHIAPNGKLYIIQGTTEGYTANEFSVKRYFSSINELRTYIDSKNIPQEIWSHQVDTSFTPQTYTAPNTKTYTIYRTNRWYMSYKLMKVRYFSTLADIQYYIRINNK